MTDTMDTKNSPSSSTTSPSLLSIPSSQIVTLIQNHLLESGLTKTSKALLEETKIGACGLLKHQHVNLMKSAKKGEWGVVLEILSTLSLEEHDKDDNDDNDDDDEDNDTHENVNNEDGDEDRDVHNSKMSQKMLLKQVLVQIHEMSILELGDIGEMDLAFATLRISRDMMDLYQEQHQHYQLTRNRSNRNKNKDHIHDASKLTRDLESKLHAISAMRSLQHSNTTTGVTTATMTTTMTTASTLPPDYYGNNGITKEKKRQDIAKRLEKVIPIIPSSRFISLVQQAIKWQVHSGEMPLVKEVWMDDDDDVEDTNDNDGDDNDEEDDNDDEAKKHKKRKKSNNDMKKNKKKKKFDLVFGQVDIATTNSSSAISTSTSKHKNAIKLSHERIPLDPYSTIKFSKKTVVTSAMFYNDVNTQKTPLITGSSDGFIEIWDEDSKYKQLRLDLEYQKKDELMCHYGDEDDDDDDDHGKSGKEKNSLVPSILTLKINLDGTMLASGDSQGSIHIWNIQTGKCLRTFDKVFGGAVTCLDFSRDGEESSRILSAGQDGSCREFGLRTRRMLKEFQGHTSFVNSCHYVMTEKDKNGGTLGASIQHIPLLVVTSSADGTVRVWNGRSAEVIHVLNPTLASTTLNISLSSGGSASGGDLVSKNIHTILPLHTPANTMIVIPRGPKAYLVTYEGVLLRTFDNDIVSTKSNKRNRNDSNEISKDDFVAGVLSPSNAWLYTVTSGGTCICFDVSSGKIEKKILDFGIESTGSEKTSIEISGINHHCHKGILGAYSSSSSLKRGLFTLWK